MALFISLASFNSYILISIPEKKANELDILNFFLLFQSCRRNPFFGLFSRLELKTTKMTTKLYTNNLHSKYLTRSNIFYALDASRPLTGGVL